MCVCHDRRKRAMALLLTKAVTVENELYGQAYASVLRVSLLIGRAVSPS